MATPHGETRPFPPRCLTRPSGCCRWATRSVSLHERRDVSKRRSDKRACSCSNDDRGFTNDAVVRMLDGRGSATMGSAECADHDRTFGSSAGEQHRLYAAGRPTCRDLRPRKHL